MNLRVRRVKLIFKTQWFVRKMTWEMTLARRSSDHDLRDLPPATHRRGARMRGAVNIPTPLPPPFLCLSPHRGNLPSLLRLR
jgi:hypothetical protein